MTTCRNSKTAFSSTGSQRQIPRAERFAVLLDPLASGAMGRGIVAGVAPVRVLVTRETDPYAEIIAGETGYLRSVPDGLTRMLWKAAGLGVQWAVVQLTERPRMAIFQLSGTWQASVPPEPDGWMKMTGCLPVYYFDSSRSYQSDASEPAETVWHAVGYPPAERAGVISLHKTLGLVPARLGCGDWAWCLWSEHECRWQALAAVRRPLAIPLDRGAIGLWFGVGAAGAVSKRQMVSGPADVYRLRFAGCGLSRSVSCVNQRR